MNFETNKRFYDIKTQNLSFKRENLSGFREVEYDHSDVVDEEVTEMLARKIKLAKARFMRMLFIKHNIMMNSTDEIEMNILKEIETEKENSPADLLSPNSLETNIDFKKGIFSELDESDWMMLNSIQVREILRTNSVFALDFDDYAIEVDSKILDINKVNKLLKHMLPETVGSTWHLAYSVDRDGWSLGTLYRKVGDSVRGCCLLIIQDSNDKIFGAMCNTHIRKSRSFYGNWLTYVFRWNPFFEKFNYSQRYAYFMYGNSEFFSIGCPKSAIRVEKNLFKGLTQECDTFSSPPLTADESFDIMHLEVWGFY